MKKLSKFFLSVSVFVSGVIFFAQKTYADVIMPGQNPSSHGYGRYHEPVSQLPTYIITGIIIIIVIIISVIILNKIRKRK